MLQHPLIVLSRCICILLCIAGNHSYGQTISRNNNIWFHYQGNYKIKKKLAANLELTYRRTEFLKRNQQWFIRPSLNYQAGKSIVVSLGYTHYETYAYGNPSILFMKVPEDHLWIQGTLSKQAGRKHITIRLRNENRFVGIQNRQTDSVSGITRYQIAGYEYRNRIRIMGMFEFPLREWKEDAGLYLGLGDEVFMNVGSFSGKTLLNQNRMIAGPVWKRNKNNKWMLQYIHQHLYNFAGNILESNAVLRLSYIHTL